MECVIFWLALCGNSIYAFWSEILRFFSKMNSLKIQIDWKWISMRRKVWFTTCEYVLALFYRQQQKISRDCPFILVMKNKNYSAHETKWFTLWINYAILMFSRTVLYFMVLLAHAQPEQKNVNLKIKRWENARFGFKRGINGGKKNCSDNWVILACECMIFCFVYAI